MALHYIAFMGRKLESEKKLIVVQIMNNVNMNSKNTMKSVGIFNDNDAMNNILRE